MNMGNNVVIWNYWGYGCAKGYPSPSNIKSDGECIVRFLWNELKLQGKLGVYGRSLGGIVATHLAKVMDIDLVIADWTLANLNVIP